MRLVGNDALMASLAADAATRNESEHAIAAAIIYICSTDGRIGINSSQTEANTLCQKLCEQVSCKHMDYNYLIDLTEAIRRYIRQSHSEPDVISRFK